MVSLELRETLLSEDKTSSDTKTADIILDLESGTIHEFDKPVPGMRLLRRNSEYCCIYRVPHSIRRVNPEAYTPQLIIIGPLHHSLKSQSLKFHGDITKPKLMDYLSMEQHKKFYLTEFARRLEGELGGEQTIDGLRKIIEEDEEMIRASYSESTVWIKSPQFIDMILHDSVFIMEFILRNIEKSLNDIIMEVASHNEASTEGDSIEGNSIEGNSIEEDSVEGNSIEGNSIEEDSIGGPLMREACHGGASHGGDSIGGDSIKGPLMRETSHGVADSIGGPSVRKPFHKGASLGGDSIGRLLMGEVSHGGASQRADSIEKVLIGETSFGTASMWISFVWGKIFMGEPLMDEKCLLSTILEDLILLENQLPYVILEKLFDGIVSKLLPGLTFRKITIVFFIEGAKIRDNSEFRHFTDLIRLSQVETLPEVYQRAYDKPLEYMYTADKLYSGGLKFEAIMENRSLNVSFENGCLKLPCLRVVDRMEMVFRNIMALEQCHYFKNAYVCNYVNFLDYLIDTHKDVELLVEKGIIKNWIGQDSLVAEMVNKLCSGILLHGSQYYDIADQVNTYYENPINKSRAILKRVYFGNLWTGTATLAATFLLLMTLIQTVASIIQTKK